jgi:hypothetical protein
MRLLTHRWTGAALLGVAFAALAAPAAQGAAAPACFGDWTTRQLEQARALRGGPEALLPLRAVINMSRTAADPEAVLGAVDAIRALPDTQPLVAAEIDALLLDGDLDRGDDSAAAVRRQRLGLVTKFLIAGPFKGEAIPADLLTELANPPAARPRWRVIETDPDGALPLHELMTPSTRTSAAAVFYLRTPRGAAVAIRYAADDRATLELDGAMLLDPPGEHDASFDQQAAFAKLEPGWPGRPSQSATVAPTSRNERRVPSEPPPRPGA